MPRFPPPCDEAFFLPNRETTPDSEAILIYSPSPDTQTMPPEEWAKHRDRILESIGKNVSLYLTRGG